MNKLERWSINLAKVGLIAGIAGAGAQFVALDAHDKLAGQNAQAYNEGNRELTNATYSADKAIDAIGDSTFELSLGIAIPAEVIGVGLYVLGNRNRRKFQKASF